MNINWKVRFKSKEWWLSMVPAVLLLIQAIAVPFGYQWDFAGLETQLVAIINAVFVVLTLVGIVVDPTTKGFSDSQRALGYDVPHDDSNDV